MPALHWYLHRLARMSAPELLYRAAQAARAAIEPWTSRLRPAEPAPASEPAPITFIRGGDFAPMPYLQQAERILAGRFDVFDLIDCDLGCDLCDLGHPPCCDLGCDLGHPPCWNRGGCDLGHPPCGCDLGHPPCWNRDPLTGIVAPLQRAASIDYRDARLVGNIKYLWEPNRHLHVPALAQAYALTGELRYAQAVRLQLDSWIAQCPPGRGPNWCSSLELAIRLINWSIAWQLLGGFRAALFASEDGAAFRQRWLSSVYQHARAIMQRLSRYSSANNHLIGETAGVWIASVIWGCWPQMQRWGASCKRLLAREALRQNAADGGNREQAFAYQQFVLDFLLLAGLAARAAGDDFPAAYWQRIERMLEFIASMMDVSGHLPMIGDADDGYVVRLAPGSISARDSRQALQDLRRLQDPQDLCRPQDPQDSCRPQDSQDLCRPQDPQDSQDDNFRSLLASGAVLFERDDLAVRAGFLDDKTRWLVGGAARTCSVGLAAFQPRRAFDQSGYYLLGEGFGTADEVRLLVDAGPLGYLSIAAHGHADALSLILNIGGREVLIDPGTYAYHTEPQWRAYFRSTRAHNTVSVDGQDQSLQCGPFMWAHHARSRVSAFEVLPLRQRLVAEHDGYCRLADPVMHRREIIYHGTVRTFTILDTLRCRAAHEVCRHWHFAESLRPDVQGRAVCVEVGEYRVRLEPGEPPDQIERHEGGSPLQGGWVSRRFGVKVPAVSFIWRNAIRSTVTLHTYLYVERRCA